VKPLALRLPIGGFNGGGLVGPDLSPIQNLTLTGASAREAAEVAADHGLDVWLYRDNAWFVRDADAPHVAHETFTLGFPPTVVADFESIWNDVGKLVAVGDDPQAVGRCNAALDSILAGRASATRSQAYFIDITHCDANKGALVLTLSKLLTIPAARIATIGDGQNDVLMFARSGLSVAMGNADPAVKAKAEFVTDSNEDDGFAKAVERFLLAGKS
jgi:Cof subfamily protein (haloacid dehalogenase superfamily)